jgi:hypothetical protein
VPRYPDGSDPQRKAANLRIGTDRSDESDYDRFALGPHTEWGLTRITAVLARSARLARRGRRLTPGQIFDLSGDDLPLGSAALQSLSKAWTLLDLCGFDREPVKAMIARVILAAPWSLDPWNAENSARASRPRPPADSASNPTVPPWVDMPSALGQALDGILESDAREREKHKSRPPPSGEPPEDPTVDWCDCGASLPKPADTVPPAAPRAVTLLLTEQAFLAEDALLAAFGSTSSDGIVEDLRALGLSDPLIARLFAWMSAVWATVDGQAKPTAATTAWREKHPVETLFARGPAPPAWRSVPSLFFLLRVLGRMAALPVHGACFGLVALARSSLFSIVVFPDISGIQQFAGDDLLRPEGETAAWRDIDHWVVSGADALRSRFGDDDHAIFRLALAARDEGFYMGYVEATLGKRGTPPAPPFAPTVEPTPKRADELPLPFYDELSTFYWKHVVIPQTAGHILYLEETADFKVADHVRFLGLFRPGGTLRPLAGTPEHDETYEQWVASVVPAWFLEFATIALLRFKFWVTDRQTTRTDEREMNFWSENHIILFASGEYITGQWWPEDSFAFTGRRGSWHRDRAAGRLERWLHDRLRFGFTEVNSPVYYNLHLLAVFNIVDFVEDRRLRQLALMVLDLLVFDVVQRVCRGSFQSATSRVYVNAKSSGWASSIRDFVEVLTGTLGDVSGVQEEAAVALCTSRYLEEVPECLLVIAGSTQVPMVARTRTSLSFDDAEALGIGTASADDIVFWWSHSAYFTNQTWRSTQSWSYRWHLRKTGPFKLFGYIDGAIIRMLSSIIGGLENIAVWVAAYTFYMPFALFFTARSIRSAVDLVTSVLDLAFAFGAWFGKAFGLLDENDDRVRVAKPALEQEFQRLAIETSAGSVAERQHLYVWRSSDAMLSSMVDEKKGLTSAQKEVCIASLGPDLSVFVSKPLDAPSGVLDTIFRMATGASKGLAENVKFWETIPGALAGPFHSGDASASPELSQALFAAATGAASGDIFEEGPKFWQGQVSNPLVWQYENVAVAIYKPTAHQRDLSGDDPITHAFWPWDQFDEVRSEEANDGRWVFGRRDRRAEPRTPCRPRAEWRPSKENPWPAKLRWKERPEAREGSGYIALFSARGLRTTPADPAAPPPDDTSDNDSGWGHKELIADGHDNVWVTIVGDQTTYGSFDAFIEAVRECQLSAAPDDGVCSIEIPTRRGPRGDDRSLLEVSWEDGATLDGEAHAELEIGDWPRFSFRVSDQSSDLGRPFSVVGAAGIESRVDWGDERWTIFATVDVPDEVAGVPGPSGKLRPERLSIVHDFTDLQHPVRRVTNLPASPHSAALRDELDLDSPMAIGGAAAGPSPLLPAQSALGLEFRSQRRALVAQQRRHS